MGRSKKKQIKKVFRTKTQKGAGIDIVTGENKLYGGIYSPVNPKIKDFIDNSAKRLFLKYFLGITKTGTSFLPLVNDIINGKARTGIINLLNKYKRTNDTNFKFSYPHVWADVDEKNQTIRVTFKNTPLRFYNEKDRNLEKYSTYIDIEDWRAMNPVPNDITFDSSQVNNEPDISLGSPEEISKSVDNTTVNSNNELESLPTQPTNNSEKGFFNNYLINPVANVFGTKKTEGGKRIKRRNTKKRKYIK